MFLLALEKPGCSRCFFLSAPLLDPVKAFPQFIPVARWAAQRDHELFFCSANFLSFPQSFHIPYASFLLKGVVSLSRSGFFWTISAPAVLVCPLFSRLAAGHLC